MSYFAATRHPWACLVFLLPLLAAYEGGVVWLGGTSPNTLRNGADAWLRWGLEHYGMNQLFAAPLLILGIFTLRSLVAWSNRPREMFRIGFGMLAESAVFAIVLWLFSRNFAAILSAAGIVLQVPGPPSPVVGQVITYVGAGIYEEVIFRLGLFSVLCLLLRIALLPSPVAFLLSGVAAAVLFAAAHHVGPYGEAVQAPVFLFRVMAGLFFTALYVFRGFGVAVGAHAGYDILVGVVLQPNPA